MTLPISFPKKAMATVIVSRLVLVKSVLRSKFRPTWAKKKGTMKPRAISLVTLIISFLCFLRIRFIRVCKKKPPKMAPIRYPNCRASDRAARTRTKIMTMEKSWVSSPPFFSR